MDLNKIKDNPSFQKYRNHLEVAQIFERVPNLFAVLGFKGPILKKTFHNITQKKQQWELFSKTPDEFNEHFANRGWIAHESMNFQLMKGSIDLAKKGKIDIAEKELINYYSSDKLKWLLSNLKSIEAFSIRYKYILLAYEDTIARRYHSVVPNLIMIIDGVVSDINNGKGFFAENADLLAWDSIAGHNTGLSSLQVLFNKSRKKTSKEKIDLPYRHGIIHGRDLGFDNNNVVAKCWAAIFAIKDWASALKNGKKKPPSPESELSINQNLTLLKDTIESYNKCNEQNELVSKKIDLWKPRQLVIGADIPVKEVSSLYGVFTPEKEAVKLAENWSTGNYGYIAKQIHNFSKIHLSEKRQAGLVREFLNGKKLINYNILQVRDCAPAISEVKMLFSFEYENNQFDVPIILRLIYEGVNGEILIFGDKGGQWKFLDSFLYIIEDITSSNLTN